MKKFAEIIMGCVQVASMPLVILNSIGSVVCAIWLIVVGKWLWLACALLVVMIVPFAYSIILLPTVPLIALSINFRDKGKRGLLIATEFCANTYVYAVITAFVFFVVILVTYLSIKMNLNIYFMLLTGLVVVCTPFSYMASKTKKDSDFFTAGAVDVIYAVFAVTYLTDTKQYAFLIVGICCLLFIIAQTIMSTQQQALYAD